MGVLTTIFASILCFAAIAAMALMWASAQEPRRKPERIGSTVHVHHDPDIICGKGYEELEDRITMTRAINLRQGGLYVSITGQVFKCLRLTADSCAVLMDINSGDLLTVRGCREYHDGKIDWSKCVKEASVC